VHAEIRHLAARGDDRAAGPSASAGGWPTPVEIDGPRDAIRDTPSALACLPDAVCVCPACSERGVVIATARHRWGLALRLRCLACEHEWSGISLPE
jgi:hypothetical protein